MGSNKLTNQEAKQSLVNGPKRKTKINRVNARESIGSNKEELFKKESIKTKLMKKLGRYMRKHKFSFKKKRITKKRKKSG
jgi:hypothetical protein